MQDVSNGRSLPAYQIPNSATRQLSTKQCVASYYSAVPDTASPAPTIRYLSTGHRVAERRTIARMLPRGPSAEFHRW
eukprot:2127666-Rhodomonas_salina.2